LTLLILDLNGSELSSYRNNTKWQIGAFNSNCQGSGYKSYSGSITFYFGPALDIVAPVVDSPLFPSSSSPDNTAAIAAGVIVAIVVLLTAAYLFVYRDAFCKKATPSVVQVQVTPTTSPIQQQRTF
jgi:hypothetical protein